MGRLDRHLYLDVNSLSRHTHWAHGFMGAYALWGGLVVLTAMTIGAWLWARQRGRLDLVVSAVIAGVAAVLALGINHFLSRAVARPRPCHTPSLLRHHLVVILTCAHDYSFPSDHAIIGGALAVGLLFFSRRLGALAAVVALFLAFARVYAGVHYPGDVVAGLLAGSAIVSVLWLALRAPAMTLAVKLSHTPLRPLVAAGSAIRT